MYSFGNKRNHGEKAKQQATVERVAPSQTLILSEQQLDDLAAEIFNQIMRSRGHKQRWKSSDLKPSKEAKLLALDQFGRWSRAPPKAKENTRLVPELLPDEKIKSKPTKEHGEDTKKLTKTLGENQSENTKDIGVFPGAYRPKQEDLSNKSTFSRNSTQQGVTQKKNWIKSFPHEEDMADSILQIPIGREGDIRPINQAYHPIQEELSHESTHSRNLTHQGIKEKKNQLKISPHEEDMQLTSRRICKGPEREQRLFNEVFRSNQDEPSCKPTCFGNLIHHRKVSNWNHFKIPDGLKVIQLLNQEMPGLPYLQSHGFNSLQTRLWRPGEAHNHSRGTYKHSGRSFIILEGLDLKTNPFKGGGDGAILDGPDLSNSPSREEEGKPKSTLSRKRLGPEGKGKWAYGKAYRSNGSEEESKAREAKPPDGPSKESQVHEAKWVCTSHTAQEEYNKGPTHDGSGSTIQAGAKAQQEAKQGVAQFVWARGEEEETWLQEPKPKKRPFHIWCWICTRKRGLN